MMLLKSSDYPWVNSSIILLDNILHKSFFVNLLDSSSILFPSVSKLLIIVKRSDYSTIGLEDLRLFEISPEITN